MLENPLKTREANDIHLLIGFSRYQSLGCARFEITGLQCKVFTC